MACKKEGESVEKIKRTNQPVYVKEIRNVHFKKNCWKSKHFRNLWLSPQNSLRVCLCLYANGLPRQRKLVKDETRWKISMRVVNWPQTVAHLRRHSSLHGSRKILILAWNSFSSWSSHILVFFNCEWKWKCAPLPHKRADAGMDIQSSIPISTTRNTKTHGRKYKEKIQR